MPDGSISPRFRHTSDQARALREIAAAAEPGLHHLLTGSAGTGKTTIVVDFVRKRLAMGRMVAVTAPTHKAVAVLRRKLLEAGVRGRVDRRGRETLVIRTLQSLLSLKPKPHGDRLVYERDKNARPIEADDVVIDEASMLSEELMTLTHRHMPMAFVLLVGDPAQLPPVGERESLAFETKSRSHLETIVRQAKGNPILDAALAIRRQQGTGALDWSWVREARKDDVGVFLPSATEEWLRRAFGGREHDADRFRYLAWTNDRVEEINHRMRRWRFDGPTPTPFMPGETAMFTSPLVQDDAIVAANNEECRVIEIAESLHHHEVPAASGLDRWLAEVPSWRMKMLNSIGMEIEVHAPRDERTRQRVLDRIKDEARERKSRWGDLHRFQGGMAMLQHTYASTVHRSQGSTYEFAFMDVKNIAERGHDNVLECQQMLYVAATRPGKGLVLVT